MQVYINTKEGGRQLVEAILIKDKKTRVLVQLADGNIIERKKDRDLPKIKE